MKPLIFVAALAAGTVPAHAVMPEDDAPPTPTETTTLCEEGTVWDPEVRACVAPKDARLDDGALMRAARELAYAGRLAGAEAALDAMSDQSDGLVLTYRGFLARMGGDWDAALGWYDAALAANPDNFLARSYLGQGLVARGEAAAARAQLSEIRARGGRNTWAEAALAMTLASGATSAY